MSREAIEALGYKYQMVPSNVCRRNATERATRTFKENFLRVLAGADEKFPMSMWDRLISQAVITLKLLRKIDLHAQLSARAHCDGQFNCNATTIGPQGCRGLIHDPVQNRLSWEFHVMEVFRIRLALHCCIKFNAVEFRSAQITAP